MRKLVSLAVIGTLLMAAVLAALDVTDIGNPWLPGPAMQAPNGLDSLESFGSTASSYGPLGARGRGNIYRCDVTSVLTEQRIWLNPTTSDTMIFTIYESTTDSVGTYNLIDSVTIPAAGTGAGWYSSGTRNVLLQAGKFYVIVPFWKAAANYYNQQAITPYPIPATFGAHVGQVGFSAGMTYFNPPASSVVTVAAMFGAPVAYYQALVTHQQPRVTWTWPADGNLNAHVDPFVKIAFSEPMNTSSFGYACNPSLGAATGLTWNATNDTLTINLVNKKSYSTSYTLDYWCEDPYGHPLAAGPVPNPIHFTTWDAPEVIHDQLATPGSSSYVAQIFGDYPNNSSYMADDIDITGMDSVKVTAVELVGGGWNGHTWHPMDSLYLGFTTDSTDLPAWSQAVWQGNLQPGSFDDVPYGNGVNNTFIMYLDPPAVLHNGKNWMTSAAYMNYAAKNGQWGWAVGNPLDTTGSLPAWRNPGGAFTYGTDWQRAGVLGMTGDGVFRLLGRTYGSPYWVSHTAMNVGGYGQAVAGWKSRVYAFGGNQPTEPSNAIRYYDTLSGTWTTTATTLPQPLYFAAAATVGDKIYIIGGSNAFATPTTTVYCYSPDGDSINTRASLLVATMEHACGVWRGTHIYVMGGGNWSMTPINNVQVYDIAADTWSAATAMPAARGVLGGAICGDYAVTAGGNSSGFNWVDDCYAGVINPADPTSITWSAGTPYPGGPRCRPSTTAYDGKLFLTSGYNGSGATATTHSYDPATDIWTPLPDKTTATLSAGQAALIGRWVYVMGGEGTAANVNEALYLGPGSGVEGRPIETIKPAVLSLMPNYPNPMRWQTTIKFSLLKAGRVSIAVYNVMGQKVKTLVDGSLNAGSHSVNWNGRNESGQSVSAGIYLYKMQAAGVSSARKLVVVR